MISPIRPRHSRNHHRSRTILRHDGMSICLFPFALGWFCAPLFIRSDGAPWILTRLQGSNWCVFLLWIASILGFFWCVSSSVPPRVRQMFEENAPLHGAWLDCLLAFITTSLAFSGGPFLEITSHFLATSWTALPSIPFSLWMSRVGLIFIAFLWLCATAYCVRGCQIRRNYGPT